MRPWPLAAAFAAGTALGLTLTTLFLPRTSQTPPPSPSSTSPNQQHPTHRPPAQPPDSAPPPAHASAEAPVPRTSSTLPIPALPAEPPTTTQAATEPQPPSPPPPPPANTIATAPSPDTPSSPTIPSPATPDAPDWPLTVRQSIAAGRAALLENRHTQALEHFEQALKVLPDDPVIASHAAMAAFHASLPDRALPLLQKALDLNRRQPPLWLALGLTHLDAGRYLDALAAFSQAATLDPRSAQARNFLGVAMGQLGWRDAAEAQFWEAIKLDSQYADAHFNMALFAMERRPPALELARRHYNRALELGAAPDPELEQRLKTPTPSPKTPQTQSP